MSGMCSAHWHYERDCPQCQSAKPQWIADLEASHAELLAALKDELPGCWALLPSGDYCKRQPPIWQAFDEDEDEWCYYCDEHMPSDGQRYTSNQEAWLAIARAEALRKGETA